MHKGLQRESQVFERFHQFLMIQRNAAVEQEFRAVIKSGQLRIRVLLSLFAGRWLRFVVSCVLLVPFSLNPALWGDHLLRAVGRWTQQGFNVIIVHHLTL